MLLTDCKRQEKQSSCLRTPNIMLTAFMQTTKTVFNASSASSIIFLFCCLFVGSFLQTIICMAKIIAKRSCSVLPTYFNRREKRCVCGGGGGGGGGGAGKDADFCIFLPFVTLPDGTR